MDPDPRRLAWQILSRLSKKGLPLDQLIDQCGPQIASLAPKDEKLFYALLMGVLRWRSQLDWALAQFARKPLNKLNPMVLDLLRMGAFQILHLERVPDFAAINSIFNWSSRDILQNGFESRTVPFRILLYADGKTQISSSRPSCESERGIFDSE